MTPVPAALPASPPPAVVPSAPAAAAAPHGWTVHTVRPGDTVHDLALRYRASVASLVTRNHLTAGGHLIYPGQRLQVPRSAAAAHAAAKAATPRPATSGYRVVSGDTLSGIAGRHRTSLSTLLKLNRMSTRTIIYPGQVVRVPGGSGGQATPAARSGAASTSTYTVRPGDTLSQIAARARTSLATVLKLNRLSASTLIHPGQRIKVPARSSAPTPGPTSFGGVTYPRTVTGAADRNRDYLSRQSVPSRSQTRDLIVATARRHGVSPTLALSIAWQESGWNQRAVSPANAIGVMQVIPISGQWASELLGRKVNLLNTRDNIEAGVVILRALSRSASSQDQAIAGYYQGLYSVQNKGMYSDTKAYVAAIKAHMKRF